MSSLTWPWGIPHRDSVRACAPGRRGGRGQHHPAPPAGPTQAQRLRAVPVLGPGPAAAICRQDQLCQSAISTCCQRALTVLSRATEHAMTLGQQYHEQEAITLPSLVPSVEALGVCQRWRGMVPCMRRPPGARLYARERRAPGEEMLRDTVRVVAHPSPNVVWWEVSVLDACGTPAAANLPCSGPPRGFRSL
jgi:hypothetical protein